MESVASANVSAYGQIANGYSTGAVSGTNVVGGLVGANQQGASITTSFTTSPVTASGAAAGTVFGVDAGEVTSVYGFPQLNGQPVMTARQAPSATGQPTALSTSQEDDGGAYQGFDFANTWQAYTSTPPTLQSAPMP